MAEVAPVREEVRAPEPTPSPSPAVATAGLPATVPARLTPAVVLALQRSAGNHLVSRLVNKAGGCHCHGECRCRSGLVQDDGRHLARSWASVAVGSGVASSATGSPGDTPQPDSAPAPAASGDCSVRVEATPITGLGALPVYHLSIVHTDAAGVETGWRGGPERGGDPDYGNITGDTGRYRPGWIDYAPGAPSVVIETGPTVCGKTACFESERVRINGTSTPYSPTGPNSNTWVRTVLVNCGLSARKPVAIAPGWGDPTL